MTYDDEYGFGTGQGLQLRKLNQPFSWHESGDAESDAEVAASEAEGEGAGNKTAVPTTCRNSVQGKILIADDKGGDIFYLVARIPTSTYCNLVNNSAFLGFICNRQDVMATGCCNPNSTSAVRYACGECHESTGCCKVYEHCISCCMDPKKVCILHYFIVHICFSVEGILFRNLC